MDRAIKYNELAKFRDLLIATINFSIDSFSSTSSKKNSFTKHFETIREQTIDLYEKGNLEELKALFTDQTEMYKEDLDRDFNTYLIEVTGYDMDLFDGFFTRVEKVMKAEKIANSDERDDLNRYLEYLEDAEVQNEEEIQKVKSLLDI